MAQQAPFGTDEQAALAVKIVGGKAFEVKVRGAGRYDSYESLSRTPYKYSTRPPWYLDDVLAESRMSNKPHLTSISSSYPPAQPTVKPHRNGGSRINTERNGTNVNSSDTEANDFMLSRMLSPFPSSKFKEIYTEMAGYDSRLSGYISEQQIEKCLQRHRVPVTLTVLKRVLPKFCSKENANMINYESLIKYLFSFSLNSKPSHVRKPSNEIDLDKLVPGPGSRIDRDTENGSELSYVSPRSLVKKAMDDREEAYLLVQMEQAFKGYGTRIVDILKKLKNDLSKLSNGTEYIKADQIERTCSWLHVPLHRTLLEKILNRFDLKKNGKINWIEFITFLEKAVPLSIQQSSTVTSHKSSSLPFWESQTPLAPVQLSPKKEHLVGTSTRISSVGVKDDFINGGNTLGKERKKWDTSHSNKQLGNKDRSYNILKVENFRDSESCGSCATDHCDVIGSSSESGEKAKTTSSNIIVETLEDKLERFSHLTEALLRSDMDNNGTLQARDVLRIVSNYNLIYNLYLPGKKVQEIIECCKVQNTNEVVIEDLAKQLWGLIK